MGDVRHTGDRTAMRPPAVEARSGGQEVAPLEHTLGRERGSLQCANMRGAVAHIEQRPAFAARKTTETQRLDIVGGFTSSRE
jgi:hypothetical protein